MQNFGDIISHPTRLMGAHPRSTYTGSQYSLTSNKLINFPEPIKFDHKINVYIYTGQRCDSGLKTNDFNIKFSYIVGEEEVKEISFFEYIYLFDWKAGCSYSLPEPIATFLRKVKNISYQLELDSFINLARIHCYEFVDSIFINSEKIDHLEPTRPIINIFAVEKQKYLRFSLAFEDLKTGDRVNIPRSAELFAFKQWSVTAL